MYTIINKMEYTDQILYTPIGYTTDQTIIDQINLEYENTFHAWINENKIDLENGSISISLFFETTPIVYNADTTVNYIENLIEITEWL